MIGNEAAENVAIKVPDPETVRFEFCEVSGCPTVTAPEALQLVKMYPRAAMAASPYSSPATTVEFDPPFEYELLPLKRILPAPAGTTWKASELSAGTKVHHFGAASINDKRF